MLALCSALAFSAPTSAAVDPANGTTTSFESPGGVKASPYALAIDDRGRVWYVETGLQPNRLIGFDPGTKQFVSVTAIPSGAGSVRHMIFEPQGRAIWFGADANTIGRAAVP